MKKVALTIMCLPIFAFAQIETSKLVESCSTTSNGVCQDEIGPIIVPQYQQPAALSFQVVSLKIVNNHKMSQLLQSVGLCSNAAYNYGIYKCESLVPRTKLMMKSSSDGFTGRLAIFLEMASNTYVTAENVIHSFSSAAELDLSFFQINDRAGFEGRGYSHIGKSQLVSIQIQNGNLSNSVLDFELFLANEKVADGKMAKCDIARCGL